MTTKPDDFDPAVAERECRQRLTMLGEHFVSKGQATVRFGRALMRKDAKWSTILKLAREAELTIDIGVNGQTITKSLTEDEPAPSRSRYHEGLMFCLQNALDLAGEVVPLSFLEGLTNFELTELAAYAKDMDAFKHGGDDQRPARPNFLPAEYSATPQPEASVEDDIPA